MVLQDLLKDMFVEKSKHGVAKHEMAISLASFGEVCRKRTLRAARKNS